MTHLRCYACERVSSRMGERGCNHSRVAPPLRSGPSETNFVLGLVPQALCPRRFAAETATACYSMEPPWSASRTPRERRFPSPQAKRPLDCGKTLEPGGEARKGEGRGGTRGEAVGFILPSPYGSCRLIFRHPAEKRTRAAPSQRAVRLRKDDSIGQEKEKRGRGEKVRTSRRLISNLLVPTSPFPHLAFVNRVIRGVQA